MRLQVYDIEGRLLITDEQALPAGLQTMSVDVSGLAPGTYVYRLSGSGEDVRSGRFTVAR